MDVCKMSHLLLDIRCEDLTLTDGEITSCTMGVGYEGDTCSFTCNTGYELTGSDTRTCQSDGSWSGSDTFCIGKLKLNVVYNFVSNKSVMSNCLFI